MKIILNNKEYTAPPPVIGLWFAIQKLKTEQKDRVVEITQMWDKIKPFEGRDDLDEHAIDKLERAMTYLNQKTEADKRIVFESKIKIIIDTFKDPGITHEILLNLCYSRT